MLTTTAQTKELTGKTVDDAMIRMAQGIIESYIGRVEAEVTDANDEAILGYAVAYQAAYIVDTPPLAFEQVGVRTHGQNESMMVFDTARYAPFLAPLAYMACRNLSWRRSRSVKTGAMSPNRLMESPRYRWLTE